MIPQRRLTKVESKVTKRDSNRDMLDVLGPPDEHQGFQASRHTIEARDQLSQDNSMMSEKVLDAVGGFPEQRSLSALDPTSP